MFIIDKIFNLKIDTKNKSITTVTGLKQFDNNSILNITLLQNSLALDLSNCTVRLNFIREDKRVLLYMTDIVSAREGKVSIKLSPEVLEKSGLVKADISVFDSNLLKITSTTFNLKVDKAIYDDTYFTDKDLDLMQQEYVREKERQNNENNRKSNESNRVQAETKRGQNENTRISNEEARKKAENTRVSEWNNVKKDANNIKNTLDTTIDTANKSNSNLKNTINAGDKLKQELNVNNYVTNAKYSEFEKKTNSQYEENKNKLNNFGGRNYLMNSNFANGFDHWNKNGKNKDELIQINEQGNVVCKNGDGDYFGIFQYFKKNMIQNTHYTMSFLIRTSKDSRICCGWSGTSRYINVKQSDDFIRYTVNLGNYTEKEVAIVLYTNTPNSTLEIENVQLEKGAIATDWNVAPEEVIANSYRLDAIEKILIEKGFMTAQQSLTK